MKRTRRAWESNLCSHQHPLLSRGSTSWCRMCTARQMSSIPRGATEHPTSAKSRGPTLCTGWVSRAWMVLNRSSRGSKPKDTRSLLFSFIYIFYTCISSWKLFICWLVAFLSLSLLFFCLCTVCLPGFFLAVLSVNIWGVKCSVEAVAEL